MPRSADRAFRKGVSRSETAVQRRQYNKMNKQGKIFSGIQPTGNLHLGNYLGAIKRWVGMQSEYECLFCIVDYHAITVKQDPEQLRACVREVTAAFIACGLDPEQSIIFAQSAAPAHTELAWILSCHTPLGWLNRMTQFKEKAGKKRDNAVLGLYSYPVLQAADILMYHTTHVPVGEDQKQHIELARDIAGAFNRSVGQEYFPMPEPVIQKEAARIMSLRDGTSKMSKSAESDMSRINLTDDAELIRTKFKKAKTDMVEGISFDAENRPEVANLLTIYAALSGESIEQVVAKYANAGFAEFKGALAEVAANHLAPITERMRDLLAKPDELDEILAANGKRARDISEKRISEIREMVGF